jgi:hypothetical protein
MSKQLSLQKTLTTAGTAYALGTLTPNESILVKALPTNTGIVYVGNDGDDSISSTTGFPLSAGELLVIDAGYLGNIYATSTVNGDKVAVLVGSA